MTTDPKLDVMAETLRAADKLVDDLHLALAANAAQVANIKRETMNR